MFTESKSEASAIQLLFGDGAEFVKVRRQHVEIRLDGTTLGQGATFKQALQVALRTARPSGSVVRASDLATPPAKRPDSPRNERTGGKATENTISGCNAPYGID